MLSAFLTIPQVTMDFGAASMARDFADGLTLWVTEFNTMYADVWSGKADVDHSAAAKFLNSTENSAAHAVHVAAYILAAMGHGRLVETMNYHSFMEGAGASSLGPHTDGGSQPGFATVAINASGSYISPVAQVLSTLAGWLGEPGATMEAAPQTGSIEVLPFTLAKAGLGTKTHTCIHAAAICARSATAENVAGEDRLIAINRCDTPVKLSLASLKAACSGGATGWAAVQTYAASVSVTGPGHTWAKTAGPLPWGPLKPVATGAGSGAPTLDAYSLSSVTLKMDDPSSALVRWQVEPPTAKVALNATLRKAVTPPSPMPLAMMRGECEHRQLVLSASTTTAELRNVAVSINRSGSLLGTAATWKFRQVGYVKCVESADIRGSGGGWRPDVLLEAPAGSPPGIVVARVPPANLQPIWVQVCLAENAPVGNHSGHATVSGTSSEPGSLPVPFAFEVEYTIEVWDILMPRLGEQGSMSTSFMLWGDSHTGTAGLTRYYPSYRSGSAIQKTFYRFLAEHRIPADEIYASGMRPVSEMVELLQYEGMRTMTLMDAGDISKATNLSESFVDSVVQTIETSLVALLGKNASISTGGNPVNRNKLPPLLPPGLVADIITRRRIRVYGFDEAAPSRATAMRELYGAIEQHWPWLRTMAVVNTFAIPPTMPLDTWVMSYSTYLAPGRLNDSQATRRAFERAKPQRETWWYWCPAQGCTMSVNSDCHGAVWPNPSVVEWPGIEGRVVFWLAALHNIRGMLFWSDDWWVSQCPGPRSDPPLPPQNCAADYCTAELCPLCCNATCTHPPCVENKSHTGGSHGPGSSICPKQLPVCHGFVAGKLYGSCQHQNASEPVCAPVRRINDSARVDFSPQARPGTKATHNKFGLDSLGLLDGGGYLFYPGEQGPLSSIRLENIRDGLEDWSLFMMLGVDDAGPTSHAADLLTQLVSDGTPSQVDGPKSELYRDDWGLMERLRREAARRVMALQQGS